MIAGVLWLVLGGCQEVDDLPNPFAPAPTEPEVRAYDVDGPLATARAVRWPEAIPARFTPRLPHAYESWEAWLEDADRPPNSAIHAGLCFGDAAWRTEFESALRDVSQSGLGVYDLQPWTQLAVGCSRPERCAWVRSHLTVPEDGGDPPARGTPEGTERAIWASLLTECRTDADAAVMETAAVDDTSAAAWFAAQWSGAWLGRSPRMELVLQDAVRRGDEPITRYVGGIVAGLDRARGRHVLLQLRDSSRDQTIRDALLVSMANSQEFTIRGMVDDLCARAGWRVDDNGLPIYPTCGARSQGSWAPEPDPQLGVGEWVRSWQADPPKYLVHAPDQRDRVIDALDRCVRDAVEAEFPDGREPYDARICLYRLAQLDRARAVAVAPGAGALGEHVRPLADTLVRYPTLDALELHLREIGLVPGGATVPDATPVDAEDVLVAQGRGVGPFVNDPGGYPLDPALLASNVAPLAGGALAGAVFESAPAEYDPITGVVRPGVLRAWFNGRVWRVDFDDLPETYDMRAVCGLLNALLTDIDSPLRYARLVDGLVIVANGDAIKLAVDEELLRVVPGDAPNAE